MTEETDIPRLDYSKPPPGFDPFHLPSNLRGTVVTAGVWGPNAVSAAWEYCRVHHDPLGTMRCGPMGLYVTFGPRLPQFLSRAAAWAWHDRRHALGLPDVWCQVPTAAYPQRLPSIWPRCLTWTDEQVTEVEQWLADSTADIPEVLRG